MALVMGVRVWGPRSSRRTVAQGGNEKAHSSCPCGAGKSGSYISFPYFLLLASPVFGTSRWVPLNFRVYSSWKCRCTAEAVAVAGGLGLALARLLPARCYHVRTLIHGPRSQGTGCWGLATLPTAVPALMWQGRRRRRGHRIALPSATG